MWQGSWNPLYRDILDSHYLVKAFAARANESMQVRQFFLKGYLHLQTILLIELTE